MTPYNNKELKTIKDYLYEGNFGIEKESLRVTTDGFLAHTKHPFTNNKNIDRDFCENQIELITGVNSSLESVYDELKTLHQQTIKTLANLKTGKEYLWPFSNPPYVRNEEEIPIASFDGDLKWKEEYRKYLGKKYGKKLMLFSGIHFNFSFPDEFLMEMFKSSNQDDYKSYKDNLYLNLAKQVAVHTPFIVYLTAASPILDGSYYEDELIGKKVLADFSSPRCSRIGYWNDFNPVLDYSSIENYVNSIQYYVNIGFLKQAAELYYPVRLKPNGLNKLEELKKTGVNHIELRSIDLNPLSENGIMFEDLEFMYLLIMYLTAKDTSLIADNQDEIVENIKHSANYNTDNTYITLSSIKGRQNLEESCLKLLNDMIAFYSNIESKRSIDNILFQKSKIFNPEEKRYANIIVNNYYEDYVKKGLQLIEKYTQEILKK